MIRVVIIEPVRLFRDSLVEALGVPWPDRLIEGFPDIRSVPGPEPGISQTVILVSGSRLDRKTIDRVRRTTKEISGSLSVVLLDQFDIVRAKDAIIVGARGFVPKSASFAVLKAALDMVLEGEVYFPSSALRGRPAVPDEISQLHDRMRDVSPRQMEVLELMVAGLSNADIARRLGIQESTVKNHVQGIFRSFNVASRTQAVVVAVQAGVEPQPVAMGAQYP